jgi:uncharacterized protein (TIGR02391 family)
MAIWDLLPDVGALLALEPEELAGVVLQHLVSVGPRASELNRYNFGLHHTVKGYPAEHQEAAAKALMEAWVWLEREGLIAPRPGDSGDWVFITRRGEQVASPDRLAAYRQANILPKQLIHPTIVQKVWATFLRGDYDAAVFQSFKEVEVRVREAGRFSPTDVGVDLMRKAFKPGDGPLTDLDTPRAEQEALMHLMAGAVGSYKNPHSHRNVSIEAFEAVEMIVLASHLLGIVDKR